MRSLSILGVFLNNEMRTGANRRYLELMEALAEKGHSVAVVMNSCLEYTPQHFHRIEMTVNYRRKGFPPTSFIFRNEVRRNFPLLKSRLEELGMSTVDWIHIHGDLHFSSALYLKQALGTKLFFAFRCNDITRAQILRKHRAYTFKEFLFSFAYNAKDRIRERKIARNSDLVTFQNSCDRDIFLKRTANASRRTKTVIIPGNIGLPRFTQKNEYTNHSNSVHTLVYVGSVSLSKGLQHLLKAIALLKDHGYTELHLAVLGKISGNEKAFAMVKSLGITTMVSFEGFTMPFPFLEKSDLMVYPTLYDAFPDTILEALHTGCPVIATRVGGVTEMLKYPELLFDIANEEQIADRIERCVTDVDFYSKLRGYCKERSFEYKFDWADRFITEMISR